MPESQVRISETATLYCHGLPRVVVCTLARLGVEIGWNAIDAAETPMQNPLGGWAACARADAPTLLADVPESRIVWLVPSGVVPCGGAATIALPLAAVEVLRTLEQFTAAGDIRGSGVLVGYRIDLVEKALCFDEGACRIFCTDREIDLLRFLLRCGADGAERSEILAQVWGYGAAIETQTLETHVSRLRSKLSEIGLILYSRAGRFHIELV